VGRLNNNWNRYSLHCSSFLSLSPALDPLVSFLKSRLRRPRDKWRPGENTDCEAKGYRTYRRVVGIGPVEYRKTDDTKSGKGRRHGHWPDGNLDSAFVAILLLPGKSFG
jgi:hypothetical protein